MKTQTLKPGLLVSLKTSIRGGVDYQRTELEGQHVNEDGEQIARWETRKAVRDPAEHDRAIEVRSAARKLVSEVCCWSSFGLLCPFDKEDELAEAITKARDVARDFNMSTSAMQVDVYILSGRIATTDEEAADALRAELFDLMDAMNEGIKNAEPSAIRDAANKARMLSAMLTEDAEQKVSDAIEQARKAAREIVKRVQKSGERAADVIDSIKVHHITNARFTFLDLTETETGGEAEKPAARGLDLDPETIDANELMQSASRQLEV